MPKKKYIYPIIYSLVLTAFTTYLALDTFVISDVYGKVEGNNSFVFSTADTQTSSVSNITDANSYSDENIQITISQYRAYNTEIYVADVTVSSLEYLKTAFANNAYGRNITQKTSDIAESVNAIFAVNGDFYGAQESGYVIRNGTLYRSQAKSGNEDLVIWANGSFEVISENAVTAQQLLDKGAYQVLSFGPGLLKNNEISVSENEEVGKAMSSNPRTAIGILGSNHFVFVVSDGRTNESTGLSLYQLAEFMQSLGVKTAYNLDGGGSSTMYFNGKVINNPTTNGKTIQERSVSDNVYIGY
jgi:exopolysaccharide biosynthesis protein